MKWQTLILVIVVAAVVASELNKRRNSVGQYRMSGRDYAPPFTHSMVPTPQRLIYKSEYLVPLRDQGVCAACWSFSVADMLADRISIYTSGQHRESLSVQEMVSCFFNHEGCGVGGAPEDAYAYCIDRGLVPAKYLPYSQQYTESIAGCHEIPPELDCERVFAIAETGRSLCHSLPNSLSIDEMKNRIEENIRNMKTELFLYGPIVGTVYVRQSLYKHKGDSIYVEPDHTTDPLIGGHAIEILGYSDTSNHENGRYWICRNSWGDGWPTDAPDRLFRIRMGTNESQIESRASSIVPDIGLGNNMPTIPDITRVSGDASIQRDESEFVPPGI